MQPSARIELVCRRALDNRPSAVAALGWYGEALEFCRALSEGYGFPTVAVAGVVAALSPMQEWRTQLDYTPQILAIAAYVLRVHDAEDDHRNVVDVLADQIPGPGFKANKRKAAAILCGADPAGVLSGDKVRAFYACILREGRTDSVCVDRHAWAIASGPDAVGLSLTANRYRATAAAYVAAAAALRVAYPGLADRLTPANVQALAWVWWRDNPESRF